ncbi:MAG TPA: outer membrane lipoprotein carrier protein LolA [Polyangiaceae bacterium]|jgi:outer membrane lipoprotein-sorting protein|nr:outer membrane lipoprotein carrier protein LolA [Polyangiaceae bacterium]
MIDRRTFLLGSACSFALSFVGLEARADAVDAALEKVTKARASIKTLQAPFKQKRVIGLLATEVVSKGKLALVRPDRLRWQLEPPDAVTYWIGPEGLAMANEDGVVKMGKAAAGRFGAVLGDLLVMLGGDIAKLRKRYDLEVDTSKGFVLTAKPKDKEVKKHVAKLRLEAGDELWIVKRVEIHEKNGDKSIIDFGKFVRDKTIPPEYMKPPKG